jgi:hypothetical protein
MRHIFKLEHLDRLNQKIPAAFLIISQVSRASVKAQKEAAQSQDFGLQNIFETVQTRIVFQIFPDGAQNAPRRLNIAT